MRLLATTLSAGSPKIAYVRAAPPIKTDRLRVKRSFLGLVVSTAINENATIALAGIRKKKGEANPISPPRKIAPAGVKIERAVGLPKSPSLW